MKVIEKFMPYFLLLLPLGFAFLPNAGGAPVALREAMQQERAAFISAEGEDELAALEGVLEFEPWRGDSWKRAGRLYMDAGNYAAALDAFKKAQELTALDAQGQVWLADMLIINGYGDAARHVLQSLNSSDTFVLLQAAALLAPLSDQESMIELLRKGYSAEPDNVEVNYQLGLHLMTMEPANALTYLRFASTEVSRAKAAKYFIQLIQEYGGLAGSGEWYLYAGQAQAQVGEWKAAEYSFDMAVDTIPENPVAWALLGETQQQLGKDGWSSLEKALVLGADNEMVNGMVGLFFRRQGNPQKALEHLRQAHEANPDAAVWLIESGKTLASTGDLQQGLQEYLKAVEINRKSVETWKALAEYCVLHNYQVGTTGLDAARQALALEPNNPVLLDLLGTAYMVSGDLQSAERFLLLALEQDPEQAAIMIHLGQLNLSLGKRDAAIEYLRRAAAAAQNERLREMAVRLLKENGAP